MRNIGTIALAIALTGGCATASLATTIEQEARLFPARALAAHNRIRAQAGVAPLVWDNALGLQAARYAVELARSGRFAHSSPASRNNSGENLWMGTRRAFSVEAMIAGWSSERSLFVPGQFPAVSRSGSWHDVGHYTQMVWPTTQRVGCAIASTGNTDYLVCHYYPAGNVIGRVIRN